MYNVQCTMYNVQSTMYNVQCTMYNVQCTMYNVQCAMYNVQCTSTMHNDNVQCKMNTGKRTLGNRYIPYRGVEEEQRLRGRR